MKQEFPPNEGHIDHSHAFADHTGRFPLDHLLRSSGFSIHERRHKKEAVWRKGETLFRYREALLRIGKGSVEDAKYLDELKTHGME